MKNRVQMIALVGLAAGAVLLLSMAQENAVARAQTNAAPAVTQGPPPWAFGFEALPAPGEVAPPCRDNRPISCGRPGRAEQMAAADDGTLLRLPGTTGAFTMTQINFAYGPADWYPQDHPPVPSIVARGRENDGVKACALCHFPNGKGKPENGSVAGLPVAYFLRQLEAFRTDTRAVTTRSGRSLVVRCRFSSNASAAGAESCPPASEDPATPTTETISVKVL